MDITVIIISVLTVLAALITDKLIPYLKVKLSNERRERLYNLVTIACKAADQLAKTGVIDLSARKAHIFEFLEQYDITYDINEVDEMIESVVLELPKLLLDENKDGVTEL